MAPNEKREELEAALRNGKGIYGWGQYIVFNSISGRAYLSCEYEGCCDADFENFDEVFEYIGDDLTAWRALP